MGVPPSGPPSEALAGAAAVSDEALRVSLPDEDATAALAARLAGLLRRGDVVALHGDLGVGKTSFARAVLRALGYRGEVPSPTFTLVQIYDLEPCPVWHVDLYRLADPEEAVELGIEEAFAEAIALIEWPDRLGPLLPADRLDIALDFQDGSGRIAELVAHGAWRARRDALADVLG
jgi:tRNA threonylcarbamoyladenosine biosynthesis protein TsaE